MPQHFDHSESDQQFKDAFEGLRTNPPSRVWNKISDALEKKPFYQKPVFWLSSVLFLGSVCFFTLFFINNGERMVTKTVQTVPAQYNFNDHSLFQSGTKGNPLVSDDIRSIFNEEKNSPVIQVVALYNEAKTDVVLMSVKTDIPHVKMVPELNTIVISFNPVLTPEQNIQFPLIHQLPAPAANIPPGNKPKPVAINLKGSYIGVFSNVNSTWLLDKEALNGNANAFYYLSGGNSFGIKYGFNFSNHFGLEADWIINSFQQQYFDYRAASNRSIFSNPVPIKVLKNFSLQYMQFPVYASFKMSKRSGLTRQPVCLNIKSGLQYARLRSAYMTVADATSEADYLFKKNDLDAVLAIDYDIYTKHRFFMTLGVRSSYGIINVYSDSPFVQYEQLQKPHNFVLGVHGSLNFSL